MNERSPLVSFIIAAYNEEAYIADCIDSCLGQTYPNIQVVVTNDGSTDRTQDVLESRYRDDPRVIIIESDANRKKIHAFNTSFTHATGDYIAIIGGDDVNFDNRIQTQINVLADYGLTFSNVQCYDESLAVITKDRLVKRDRGDTVLQFNQLSLEPFGLGSIVLRRDVAAKIFPMPEDIIHEDWYIPLLASHYGPILFTDAPLYKYRIHRNNSSAIHASAKSMAYHDLRARQTRDRFYFLRVAEKLESLGCRNESIYNLLNARILFALCDEEIETEILRDKTSLTTLFDAMDSEFVNASWEVLERRLYRLARTCIRFDHNDLSREILGILRAEGNRRYAKLRAYLFFNVRYSAISKYIVHTS